MRLGIRAQLVVWLVAVMALAFAPLIYAIASLARATFTKSWEQQARGLGRAVAAHVSEARAHRTASELPALLEAQVEGEVGAIGVYDGGALTQAAGAAKAHLPTRAPSRDDVQRVTTERGPALLVIVPSGGGAVAALLHTDPAAVRVGPLLQLIALYIGLLGLGLSFAVYVLLTRLVVGPVERLSRAARRVTEGTRELAVPKRGGRELVDLGVSLASMTASLRGEEQKLISKVEELETAHQKLSRAQDTVIRSERLASVGRLAAGLAHEIGNPISAILSFQELVLDGPLEDDQRDFVQRMKRETERVNRILRDLLDFARPTDAADTDDADASASVKNAIEHVVALIEPQKAFADVTLTVTIEDALPAVAIRADRIEQVLLNLLLNAADVVEPPDATIRIEATVEDNGVLVAIEDNGGGIAPSVRGRLFEPFVTTKDVGEGTGLGLAVCRGLVEAVGGTIGLGEGSEGARFEIVLPVVD